MNSFQRFSPETIKLYVLKKRALLLNIKSDNARKKQCKTSYIVIGSWFGLSLKPCCIRNTSLSVCLVACATWESKSGMSYNGKCWICAFMERKQKKWEWTILPLMESDDFPLFLVSCPWKFQRISPGQVQNYQLLGGFAGLSQKHWKSNQHTGTSPKIL